MSHHHHHHHNHDSKNILLAFTLNFVFSIIEFIGAYLTNSVAIYSDALHDLGDSMALLLSYFAEKMSLKKPDHKYTFGYRRFSILSALLNGIILFSGSLYVIYESILRLKSPETVHPEGMLALAFLGITVNGFAAYRLSKNGGMNSKMVMLHLLEDILGWVGILIISIILFFKPWFILDSIMSLLIALIILKGVYKNILKTGQIFLQRFPDELEIDKVKSSIEGLDNVLNIHAIKGWSIDSDSFYLRFHIKLPTTSTIKEIDELKIKIKEILKNYKIFDSTIEFESEDCSHQRV